MNLAALYPSATGGAGSTLSPLGAAAPVAETPEPAQAPEPETQAEASTDPDSATVTPPVQPEPASDVDAELDALIEGTPPEGDSSASDEPPAEAEPAQVNLTVDERPDFFLGARSTEPPASSPTDFASIVRSPSDKQMEMPVVQDALRAAVRMGIGQTAMQAVWAAAVDASRNPIKTTPEAAHAALAAEWGESTATKLASARAWIDRAETTWPGIRPWLHTSGLGNDVGFLRFVAAQAARRGL